MVANYPDLKLYIAGEWRQADGQPVINPADESTLATRWLPPNWDSKRGRAPHLSSGPRPSSRPCTSCVSTWKRWPLR